MVLCRKLGNSRHDPNTLAVNGICFADGHNKRLGPELFE